MNVGKLSSLSLIFVMILPFCAAQVDGKTINAEVTFFENSSPPAAKNIEIIDSSNSKSYYKASEPYEVSLNSKSKELWRKHIPVSFSLFYQERGNGSLGSNEVDKIDKRLLIPLYHNATEMRFYYDKKLVNTIQLPSRICNSDSSCSSYCSDKDANVGCTCGDGKCQENLNERQLCPQDCSDRTSPDETNENEQNQSSTDSVQDSGDTADVIDSGHNTGILILIGIFAILLSLILASSKVKIEA